MKVFATHKNGDKVQYQIFGDLKKIIAYIENYSGSDLGNDLICEDFVKDAMETGVVIYAENN